MSKKEDKLSLFNFKSVNIRIFHITWFTFFLCFFSWFAIAPLMSIIREDLQLTKEQVANTMIASVAATVFARLFIGWLCDRVGPRIAYTGLLIFGAVPLLLVGLSNSYETFLLFRLAIGTIGASFVITQYHTSVMFAPRVVGTANATAAGWGNLGGGITQMVMPLVFTAFLSMGFAEALSWRLSMLFPGMALLIMAFVYYFCTQDTPEGNFSELRKGKTVQKQNHSKGAFWIACKDYRTWILFVMYGCCFGVEIMMDNIAALYFIDEFKLDLQTAGMIAGLFGLMNIFARALGGIIADKVGWMYGTKGKAILLGIFIFIEGAGIVVFSMIGQLTWAVITLVGFALFVKMSNGITYSIVPFINKKALGSIAGIVGAGGNVGAVLFTSLFKTYSHREGLLLVGVSVLILSFLCYLLKFKQDNSIKSPEKTEQHVEQSELMTENV
ncbi:MAG: NarK family nitrate/nitrite MFS transporter [Cytophagaceae bacterium]|nr:NarK family nitrate/nitrite MFS transporter [Cytophagaceae bacterium]MDW8455278.1 NarK family nitrate/nitrite MFS transporter [Cytophagaceae bacterium]